MRRILLAAALVAAALPGAAQQAQVLDPSLMEALAAIEQIDLAGLFAYIPGHQAPEAFAEFLARNEKAQKKYVGKVEKDYKKAGGLTAWDKAVLQDMVALYGSPMAQMLPKKPAPKFILKMADMVGAPTLGLEQIAAKRGR